MSVLSGLAHLAGNVAAPIAEAAGAVGSLGGLAPNAIANQATMLGHNISNPNVSLSNPGGVFGYGQAFTGPGAYGHVLGASTTAGAGGQAGGNSPTTQQSGVYTNGTGGTGTIDPTTGLSYDQLQSQVQGQLGNLDSQSQVGNQNILDAYNNSFNQLTGSKAIAQRNYDSTKAQTLQDYVGARGNNQAQVGQQANSLQRLLGAHGYSGSANEAAAYAAARQGAIANQSLQQGYGRNQQALDTNFGDYTNNWNSSANDLGHQRDVQQQQLQSQVDQNKQGLLQQLSAITNARGGNGAVYQPQIDQLGQQVTQLGRQFASPVIQATAPVYQAPSLASYNTPAPAAPTIGNTPGAADNVNPFLNVLLGQDKNKNLNNIGA
jgi:hypothetical protein